MVRIQSNITLSVGLALHAFFLLGTSSPTIFADAQSVTYSTGSRGTDCATNPGGGYEPITTAEECQAAATNGGFDYSSDTSNLSNPGGCNLTWGTNFVSFNTDNNNESGEFSVPFCKFNMQAPVDLKSAGDYALLSKSGVTTTGVTHVEGDMGTSPIDAGSLTGFGLIMHSSNTYSTSTLVDGKVYAADYATPTPSKLTEAVLDMEAAYDDAAGRPDPDYTEHGSAGNIDGFTLEPGLYKWGTDVGFTSSLTFQGNGPASDDVWILQIAGNLEVGSTARVELTRGAKAENIFWQIAGTTDIGTYSHMEGIFLCKTNIVFKTGSSMNGAALAQTAITMDATTIEHRRAEEEEETRKLKSSGYLRRKA